jgi:hypothetical protein
MDPSHTPIPIFPHAPSRAGDDRPEGKRLETKNTGCCSCFVVGRVSCTARVRDCCLLGGGGGWGVSGGGRVL